MPSPSFHAQQVLSRTANAAVTGDPTMPRLVTITTHPITLANLMRGQLAYLRERGLEVIVISSPGPELDEVARREGVRTIGVPMERAIRPWRDFRALLRLHRVLCELRPDVVEASTAKAGLLGMLAALSARVPRRVYLLRGLRAERLRGVCSWLLRRVEWMTARAATHIRCVSPSLARLYCDQGFADAEKVVVLGSGSSNGVDAHRYSPRRSDPDAALRLRAELGIAADAPVVGFVGRLVRDKGIGDLLAAMDRLCRQLPEARLLLLGPLEQEDPVAPIDRRRIEHDPRVIAPGAVADAAPYYPVMDVLALPSYREGFPNAALEAAAAEVPVVAYRVTGSVDAVEDGVTGRLVEPGGIGPLADALRDYLVDPQLQQMHGQAGRERVLREFRQEPLWEAIYEDYCALLADAAPQPASCSADESAATRP